MSKNTSLMVGGAGALVGFVLGNVTADRGPDLGAVEDRLAAQIEASIAASAEAGSGLGEQLSGLSDSLGSQITALGEQLGTLEGGISSNGEAMSGVSEALQASLADLQTALAETAASVAPAPAPEPAAPAEPVAAAPEPAPAIAADVEIAPDEAPAPEPQAEAASDGPVDGLGAGQTAILADGAVRAFVSRVTDTAAHVAINGLSTVSIGEGRARMVVLDDTTCLVSVDSVGERKAALSALCGDDMPEPSGVTVGSTAVLGDGAARVFVSSVGALGDTARVAINGLTAQTVEPGTMVEIDRSCSVEIEGIDRGHVAVGYVCD